MLRFYCLFLVFVHTLSSAQTSLKGKCIDAATNQGVSFATISLVKDKKIILAGTADDQGVFVLKNYSKDVFDLQLNSVGYESKIMSNVNLTKDVVDLGNIMMTLSDKTLKELTVTAEKSSTEISLDKRVFNVGKDLANAGGSALDILVNVPSVSVDPDGALKLRGSGNVRILIDGKPSGMVSFKGGAGLRQLQASMIDRVEVITNPSARYEAEGQAGIINIILKKDSKQGLNGSFELITGRPDNYGAAANINYRKKNLNFFINYSLAYKGNPYQGDLYQEVRNGNSINYLDQTNSGTVYGFDNNIRGGLDYYFNENSVLTASYLFSRAGGNRYTENIYRDFLGTKTNLLSTSTRIQDEVEKEPMSEYVLSYKKSFKKKGHEINGQFRFLDHFENSDQVFTQNGTLASGAIDSRNTFVQTSVNDEFEKQYLFQLDYQKPILKAGKMEWGTRASWRDMVNDFVVNDVKDGKEVAIDWLDNYFIYNENIYAAYGIFSNKIQKVSYQLGLRGEYSDVSTVLRKTNERNPRTYGNFFPSAHFTYKYSSSNTVQMSYSRRIRRPVYNDLSPFMTLSDNRNFFSGNPDLNPEYSDVYELANLTEMKKGSLSTAIYFRNAQDNIFSIRSVDANGFSTSLPQNLNSEKAYGLDLTASYSPVKWWKTDQNLNVFRADIDGSNIEQQYKVSTNTWFARHTSRITMKHGIDAQMRANYEAAQKTAQGSRKAIFFMDLSLKKNLWNKKGALNFSVLDVFNSRWSRTVSEGPGFYTLSNRQFRPRQINLTLSYRLKS